jgi:hypothetical protein
MEKIGFANKSVEKQFHENITKIQFDYNTC